MTYKDNVKQLYAAIEFASNLAMSILASQDLLAVSDKEVSEKYYNINSTEQSITINKFTAEYLPYIEFRLGQTYGNSNKNGLGALDLFLPLWQYNNRLFFADLRIVNKFGFSFEGNAHLGYRHLFHENKIFGGYIAFDRRKSIRTNNYFNQLTFGIEHWSKNLFIGGNIYYPIGNKNKKWKNSAYSTYSYNRPNIEFIDIHENVFSFGEKPFPGADIEIGYEFKEGLITYLEGYYFRKAAKSIAGPKVKIEYNIYPKYGKKFLGTVDAISFEGSVQKDNTRGITAFTAIKIRVGLPHKVSKLQGIEHHMVDLVRRDIDVVTNESIKQEKNLIGKVVKIEENITKEEDILKYFIPIVDDSSNSGISTIYVMYTGGIYKHSDLFNREWEKINNLLKDSNTHIVLAAKDISFGNNSEIVIKYDKTKSGTISKTFEKFIKTVDKVRFYGVDIVDTPWCFEQAKILEKVGVPVNATNEIIKEKIFTLRKNGANQARNHGGAVSTEEQNKIWIDNNSKLEELEKIFIRLPKWYAGDCEAIFETPHIEEYKNEITPYNKLSLYEPNNPEFISYLS